MIRDPVIISKLYDTIATIVIFYHRISTMIELRWLRSFLAVADEMHLSRAARKLHLAQPALTTQIQQLERSLGSSLFQRSNRISGLTAAGLVLLSEARAIVARAEALPRIVERAARGETGRLRLGIIPPAATNRLAECLRTIASSFGKLTRWPSSRLFQYKNSMAKPCSYCAGTPILANF